MNLEKLRTDTRPDHEATESVMPLMHADLSRDQYTAVLLRLYPVVQSWESWAAANAPADLIPTIEARQRTPLLAQDLHTLDIDPPHHTTTFPAAIIPGLDVTAATFRSAYLGAMYVMEGSTLGGQYIAKHLEDTLHFTPGMGDAYFRGYGEHTGEMWRTFKSLLAAVPDHDTEIVIAAAKAMFSVFRAGMLSESP